MKNKSIEIAGEVIQAGERKTVLLPSSDLYTQTKIDIPVHVFHGLREGPKLFVISTIHGDELNGIEIIRRLHHHRALKHIHGTLITIPVINTHGFLIRSRYLPDRRDLNRSFPGSSTGSLAARLANTLIEEVVSRCELGIDIHTGSHGRTNMSQIRTNLDTPGARELAKAFEVPIVLDSKLRDGSLRQAASELGIPLLVFEGGENLRLNEMNVRSGLRGILKVMNYLEMIKLPAKKASRHKPIFTQTSRWVRASVSGLLRPHKDINQTVRKGDKLATIHDPFLMNESQELLAPFDGIVIGRTKVPLVNLGDAIFNIASIKKIKDVEAYIEEIKEEISQE